MNGGMDLDSMPEAVKVFVRRNCRSTRSGDGGSGSVRPIRSMRLVPNSEMGTDTLVIGRYVDEGRQRLFFFVYEGGGLQNHGIYCYDRREDRIYTLLRDNQVPLDFDPSSRVFASMTGDHLVFTDNLNQPKKFDVERAIRTYDPTYVSPDGTVPVIYEGTMMERDITLIRRPGSTPLTIEKVESANEPIDPIDGNFIDGKSFQFTYRLRYRDGNYSVSAPYSFLAPHNREEQGLDAIKVTLEEEVIDYEVYGVEFMVRRGNEGSFYLIEEINRDKDGDTPFDDHNLGTKYTFYYDGRDNGIPVADADAYTLFHDVPLRSQGVDIAKNRVFLANNLKGYDSVTGITIGNYNNTLLPEVVIGEYYKFTITCPSGTTEHVRVKISGQGVIDGWYGSVISSIDPADFDAGLLDSDFTTSIDLRLTDATTDEVAANILSPCGDDLISFEIEKYTVLDPSVFGIGSIRHNQRVFKDGFLYKFGIVFFDEAGRTPGVSDDIISVSIPERVYHVGIGGFVQEVWLFISPADVPEWAHSWGVAYSRDAAFFVGDYTDGVRYAKLEDDGSYSFETTKSQSGNYTDGIGVNISRLTNRGIGWVYSNGDRLKIWSYSDGPFFPEDDSVSLSVIAQQGDWLICKYKQIGDVLTLDDVGQKYLFEISRNVSSNNESMYEIGQNYPIINPGEVDREMFFPFYDFAGTGYVKVKGDAYFTNILFDKEARPVIAMNPDDRNWALWHTDQGRPFTKTYIDQERYEQEVAWGQQFLRGTNVNNLNDFRSGDVAYVDEVVGALQSLIFTSGSKDQGNVMLAIGRSGCASLYIGRTQIYSNTESADIVSTGDVVGAINVLDGGFGTFNPESVSEDGGRVYWFSTNQPAYVRYNLNGPYPISEKGMASVAKYVAKKVSEEGVNVIGGVDTYHGEALFSIPALHQENAVVLEDILDVVSEKAGQINLTSLVLTEKGALYKVVVFSEKNISIGNFEDFHLGKVSLTSQESTHDGNYLTCYFVAKNNAQSIQVRAVDVGDIGTNATITVYRVREYPHSLTTGLPYVLAFSDNEPSKWELAYTMAPDAMASIGDLMAFFFKGELWVQDGDGVGNIFGVNFPASVAFPSGNIDGVSVFQGISLASTQAGYVHVRSEFENTQGSDVEPEEFVLTEGVHYHEIMNDRLTPGSASFEDGLFRGDSIRARVAKIFVEFKAGIDFILTMVGVNTRGSTGHKLK